MFLNDEISFDDEVANITNYHKNENKIEVFFEGFYRNSKFHNSPCCLVIKDWSKAKVRKCKDKNYRELEHLFENISMILVVSLLSSDEIEITVNTDNNNYFDLYFKAPTIYLCYKEKSQKRYLPLF